MSSIPATEASSKPVQHIHATNLPANTQDPAVAAEALHKLVEHSAEHSDVRHGIHAPIHTLIDNPLVHKLIPGLENFATEHHVGNYVVDRETGKRFFESMPIYPRLGMHLLFYGGEQRKILHNKSVEVILKDLSIHQGKIYDGPESGKSIPSFIDTYSIQTNELLEPDISKYRTFNEFFHRKLKSDARPIVNPGDTSIISSAADCRLVVYPSTDLATKYWIKGNQFTIPGLLGVPPNSERARAFEGASVASFRLAPADYHRFHSPIDAIMGDITEIPGQYYTVNPQAVNEPGFDVFTANKRAVLYLTHAATGKEVAFVAIGAMLVGSIVWTTGGEKGRNIQRGEELGYFAYGGSTVVVLFPKDTVTFDDDLVRNSNVPIETLMKVGWSVGRVFA